MATNDEPRAVGIGIAGHGQDRLNDLATPPIGHRGGALADRPLNKCGYAVEDWVLQRPDMDQMPTSRELPASTGTLATP